MNSFDDTDSQIDSAITPVDVDKVQSETAAQGDQTQAIEDQVLTAEGDGDVEQQESEEAKDEASQEADISRLGWTSIPPPADPDRS